MSVDDPAIEAALKAALGLSAHGGADVALHHAPPTNQLAIASAITAVAIIAGLFLARHLPRPSTIAADRSYIAADQASRRADLDFYARRVEEIRLRNVAFEHDDDGPDSVSHAGAKVFVPEGVFGTHAGAKAFGGQQ
jgi:hypothetical protein